MMTDRTFDEIVNAWKERRQNVKLAWEVGIFGTRTHNQLQRREAYKDIIEKIATEEEIEILEVIQKGRHFK